MALAIAGSSGKGSPGGQSVRVVVRVRPPGDADGNAQCSALSVAADGLHVSLTAPLDNRSCKQFQFDAALSTGATQVSPHARMTTPGLMASGPHPLTLGIT